MNKNIDWKNLPFAYMDTNCNVRCYYKNGKWGEIEETSDTEIPLHMAAVALHYGQQAFEGLKVFMGKDGQARVFRWEENARRLQSSARGILMTEPPESLFKEMLFRLVEKNRDYIPPYGTGASLYIRPLLIGINAQVGVKPATDYLLLMFATPVGPYFKTGFSPVSMLLTRKYDRVAPLGTGRFKVGGNYAASLTSMEEAHKAGYANVIYLDAKEKKYIDECGPANFFGIKNNTYITPESESILPSITNKSLMQLAEHLGMKVERRPVEYTELETFEEVGACGTAAVISPISKIQDEISGKVYSYGEKPGKMSTSLYEKLIAIQYAEEPDPFGWTEKI